MSTPTSAVLARAEGTSFTLRTWAPATADLDPVLLIQPAMGMPAGYYHRLCAALADAGLTTALTELRGHETDGGRIPSHAYDFGYAEMLDDLDAALTEVERQHPGRPVVLLGHSMGGQLGLAFAAAHPGRIAGLVLVGSGTPYWRDFRAWLLGIAPLFRVTGAVLGHFPGKQLKFAGRESKGLIRDWSRFALTGRLPGASAEQLAALELPILDFHIVGDSLAPMSSVAGLVALAPRTTVELRTLEGEGIDHFRWARRPESVVDQIVAWSSALVGDPA